MITGSITRQLCYRKDDRAMRAMRRCGMPQMEKMAISPQLVVRATSCLVIGWGFLGRRI